jgi:dipeptidyl aminopeptidase/acylaminoacyl peptidase
VDKALPGRHHDLSRGGNRLLIHSSSDVDPGAWHLYDLDARRLEYVASERGAIKPETMPRREPVRYPARDGLEIPAYVTLPPNRAAKALPLVLYVHGGPWVRGATWHWRDEPAFLAAQGYAVLEPEFRGSTGFGRRLFQAGWKEWGRAMQDDLSDGIDWLAQRGTIDPSRVCIMGASYGGYAVMMGLARDAERYRCGVNYVGVTDISLMFDVTWSDMHDTDFLRYNAKEMIGDPERDAAQFKATSPLANAAKVRAPVLMAYGAQDNRVPLVHGERMRDALQNNGTRVDWIVYADEGHGFLREANRFDFYGRVAKFLEAHLKP